MNKKIVAKLGGRYRFESEGSNKYLNIYYVKRDIALSPIANTISLTPTIACTCDIGDEPWRRFYKNGVKHIILFKDAWDLIKHADMVEIFDQKDRIFYPK